MTQVIVARIEPTVESALIRYWYIVSSTSITLKLVAWIALTTFVNRLWCAGEPHRVTLRAFSRAYLTNRWHLLSDLQASNLLTHPLYIQSLDLLCLSLNDDILFGKLALQCLNLLVFLLQLLFQVSCTIMIAFLSFSDGRTDIASSFYVLALVG